jgi:hypothetical protein
MDWRAATLVGRGPFAAEQEEGGSANLLFSFKYT